MKNRSYYNFRCRKCGNYISIIGSRVPTTYTGSLPIQGITISSKYHPNCTGGLMKDEQAFADMISVSLEPLSNAVDILTDTEQ